MSLIRFHNLAKQFDSGLVFREVYFRLERGDRVGLIGKNGVGKTTALRLILGQEEPSSGTVEIESGVRIGYFSQFSQLRGEDTVLEVLERLFAHVHAIQAELDQINETLADPPTGAELDRLLQRQAELFDAMDRCEGWTYRNRIDTVLTKLGFNAAHRERSIEQLSGGWRNRAALAQILLQAPDVLLMDEPTNYLDVAGLAWVEEWFRSLRGALIVVSHDRHFLDKVVNRVVEIENYHFQEYKGSFSDYVHQKQTRLKTLERQFQHEGELLAYEAEAIHDRSEAARNPSRALKRKLANVKRQVEPRPVDRIITGIYSNLHVPNNLCRAEGIAKAYDDQILFMDLSFEVQRGDRVAVLGPNGCGKSTLLQVLVEDKEPDEGRVVWSKAASFVHYNEVFEQLDPNDTVTHAVNIVGIAYRAPRKRVNRFLSLMQFSEMDLQQRIGTLSGGQRARVALAQCLLSGAGLILLDEPTNHLDLTSTQVMERALIHFPGAVVVVSHDRFFIDKVATRLLVFEDEGVVREVAGNWTIWQASQNRDPG